MKFLPSHPNNKLGIFFSLFQYACSLNSYDADLMCNQVRKIILIRLSTGQKSLGNFMMFEHERKTLHFVLEFMSDPN